jgi:poly-beta-hydroxybutyrate-responsive repressor
MTTSKSTPSSAPPPAADDQPSDGGAGPSHPTGDMLNAQLLAMLKDWSAYGYELAQKLEQAGFGNYNKGTVYRALRQMEGLGLVSSIWDTSSTGPARRMYSMTRAGNLFLQNWLTLLNLHRATLERFLSGFGGGDPR